MNQRKQGIFLSYLNIFLHAFIGFLYVPLLLHYIGKNEYGLYQLIGSLIAYFSVMDFGLTAAVVRFYAKYRALKDQEGMENILAIALRGYAVVDALVLAVGAFCYFHLDQIFGRSMGPAELTEASHIFLLLLFNIAITLSTRVFQAVINAEERFLFLKGTETVQLVLQPILVVLVLQKYPYAFSVAAVQTLINVVLILARFYYCFGKLHIRIKYHYWNHELYAEFSKLALSIFSVAIIDQVFWKTNQVILGIISGTAAVAVYSVASLVYLNYMSISVAISGVYLPHISGVVAQENGDEYLSDLFIQVGRAQYYLLALVTTGFIIFGRQFIAFWAGPGFQDAYAITLLIILPFTIDLIQNIGLAILQAKNQYDFRAKVYSSVGILNIVLAIPLGIRFGGIGCAFSTGFSMFVGNGLIMNWFYNKYVGIDILEFWREIGKITVVVAICCIAGYAGNLLFMTNSKFIYGLKIILYTIFYCIILYRYSFNIAEKRIIAKVKQRIISEINDNE